jgi:hypothetical protein
MPYHQGELAVQKRAGTVRQAGALARGVRAFLPPPLVRFLAEQRWIVVGGADSDDFVWASLLVGKPGFVKAAETASVRIDVQPPVGDPLRGVGSRPGGESIGLLAIDFGSRRRARMNGVVHLRGGQLVIDVEQAYANCMKYIQRREIIDIDDGEPASTVPTIGERMSSHQIAALRGADTAFIATVAGNHGADVSHRGGPPGFLDCSPDGTQIRFVDYPGNGMFNTLGNVEVDERAGITVPFFDTRSTLQLTGSAVVEFGPDASRTLTFRVRRVIESPAAWPVRFGPVEYSPFLPSRDEPL